MAEAEEVFDVTGMTCAACSAAVQRSVEKLPGVEHVSVNLLTNTMRVRYDEDLVSLDDISRAVSDAGYRAFPRDRSQESRSKESGEVGNSVAKEAEQLRLRLLYSVLFIIPLMYVSMGHMFGWPLPAFLSGIENAVSFAFLQFLLTIPVVFINREFYTRGFRALLKGRPNMDSLIAIGSSSALIYGIFAVFRMSYGLGIGDWELVNRYYHDLYFESCAMILTLITVGKYLEAVSKSKTTDAVRRLMDLAPKTATLERNGEEVEVSVESVNVGDVVIIKPGEAIPVDGVVIEGKSYVDESMLTGESIPIPKQPGDRVSTGTINGLGVLKFRATQVGSETTLAKIIALVEEANATKPPIAKLADDISAVFVPVVMCIALVTVLVWLYLGYSFELALSLGISVLVISCPCALGLATPVAIMVGTGKGAEYGILIKSGEALETLHVIDTIVIDKTGTLTVGKPEVTDILLCPLVSEKDLLAVAQALEKNSEHPIAGAILDYAAKKDVPIKEAADFKALSGQGVSAYVEGVLCIAGNEKLMTDSGIDVEAVRSASDPLSSQGKTPLYFAKGQTLLGIIAVADVPRATSAIAVRRFKEMGLRVFMLTGDNRKTAEAIALEIGIDDVLAEVLPDEKDEQIRMLQAQGRKVAMVGDGINDAPALARADVGIAIGAGTDVAIDSADVVLIKNDLLDVVAALELSETTLRNIKQNLFWAFFYNVLGIPLAAGVLYPSFGIKLTPMIGAAAMSMSSLFVVTNALRLRKFKPTTLDLARDPMIEGRQHTVEVIQADVLQGSGSEEEDKARPSTQNSQGGDEMMKLRLQIDGMMCEHCKMRVEKALNGIDGVSAQVDLDGKCADVALTKDVPEEVLKKAVEDAGYQVVSIGKGE
ncbi:MAG: heavy metal translocating P-type ATPase [Firmicutes bacterium]|nr:heavy metal translocating P-type ATPase [Candidatus Fermentithermobacillaceae bacterium]